MANVQASTGTKRAPRVARLPKTTVAVKRGRKPAVTVDVPEAKQIAKPSDMILVNALEDAGGFHRDALLIELAVGLVLFASQEGPKPDLPAKKHLRAIYQKAGYECKTPAGEDYKTVARRVNVAALLFTHLGGKEAIYDYVDGGTPKQQVARVAEHLKQFKFDGVNSVLAYVGKPVDTKGKRKEVEKMPPAPKMTDAEKQAAAALDIQIAERRDAEAKGIPPGRIITSGKMQAVIPFEATYDDVMKVALELMTFAKTQMQLPVATQPGSTTVN